MKTYKYTITYLDKKGKAHTTRPKEVKASSEDEVHSKVKRTPKYKEILETGTNVTIDPYEG